MALQTKELTKGYSVFPKHFYPYLCRLCRVLPIMPKANDPALFGQLQMSIDAIARGLSLMNDTLGTHSEMLTKILEAATREVDEESPLVHTLEKIFIAIKTQTDVLAQIGGMLDQLGPTVERAVMRGTDRAGSVDPDGAARD